jgi:hypothetical protein
MKKIRLIKSACVSSMIALSLAISLGSSAMADHKSNVPDYDFATNGANYPGWHSEGACAVDRPGQGCQRVVDSCGKHNNPIYSTQRILDALRHALNNGQQIPVNLMSATGHFINVQCTLG